MRYGFAGIVALFVTAALSSPAHAVLIDSFDPAQPASGTLTSASPPSTISIPTAFGGVGDTRTLSVSPGDDQTNQLSISGGLLRYNEGGSTPGTFNVNWTPTSAVSLVSGGEVYLTLIGRSASGMNVLVTISDGTNSFTDTIPVTATAGTANHTYQVALTDFTSHGVNLGAVTSITATGTGTGTSNFFADSFMTSTPEPSSLALLALGACGLGAVYRRRAKQA